MLLNMPIFILADFNCDILRPTNPETKAFLDLCNCFNFTQIINQPTRITQYSRTLLDVIFTNKEDLVKKTNVVSHSISDHELVVATLSLKKPRPRPTYVTIRSFKHYNREAFLQDIAAVPLSVIDIFEDTDDKLNVFNISYNQVLDQHAPIKTIKVNTHPVPFMNDNIRALTH